MITSTPGPRTRLVQLHITDDGLLDNSWRSGTKDGRTVWHAAITRLTPTAVMAIAHLTAEGWSISIETDRRNGGLFITMIR